MIAKPPIAGIIAGLVAASLLGLVLTGCGSPTRITRSGLSDVTVSRIALMPFLAGRMESPDAPIVQPLNVPLSDVALNRRELPEGSDLVMNRIVGAKLRQRFAERLVPPAQVAAAYRSIETDPSLDTPRKRAVSLGNALEANLVMVGSIWWYREKGPPAELPEGAASVGFALYLVDVGSGARVWRGIFEGTQEALTQDVLGGLTQLDMGLRWLSAEELADYGVQSVLRKLPLP